jgi:hypothetical protein
MNSSLSDAPKTPAGARKGIDMRPDDEEIWLRHPVIRMRALLRFAREPHVESGLRELIADAEKRLEPLENGQSAGPAQSNQAMLFPPR